MGTIVLFLILEGMLCSFFFSLSMMLVIVLSYIVLIELRCVPSIPNLSRAFYHEGMVDFFKAFSASIEIIYMISDPKIT